VIRAILAPVFCLSVLVACSAPVPVRQAVEHDPIVLNHSHSLEPVAITTVSGMVSRRPGAVGYPKVGEVRFGNFCMGESSPINWGSPASSVYFTTVGLEKVARREFERAGWPVVPGDLKRDLFTGYDDAAELLIAAVIEEVDVNICRTWVSIPIPGMVPDAGKGELYLKVQWQVYASAKRKVIATFDSEGTVAVTKSRKSVEDYLLVNGFSEAVRNLLSSSEFLAVVSR